MTNDGKGNFRLSPREQQVLRLMCDGLTYRMIGVSLGMSVNTVHRYAASFFRAFQLTDRSQLADFIRANGEPGQIRKPAA